MDVTDARRIRTGMPTGLAPLAALGAVGALAGTYWDDSWHTDKGRDAFAIPPHLVLYGGVLLTALTVAAWGLLSWRSAGWGFHGLRHVLCDQALVLAGMGGLTTLGSAPVDNAWHAAFGRDAVLWSPPHLVAVAGTLALSVGVLAGLRRNTSRGGAMARVGAAVGVIGTLQVPVLEYDSDVPQFSTMWFLPVAAMGVCIAVAVLDDLLPSRWTAAKAALAYTALRIGIVALLSALGFSVTVVPPILVLFLVSGALVRRPRAERLVIIGSLTPIVWWPFLELQADVTTTVPLGQLPASVLLGAGAGLVVALIHRDVRPGRPLLRTARVAAVLVVLVLGLGATSERAEAHDPGQGQKVREGQLAVERVEDQAKLTMTIPGDCDGLVAVGTVARRAGQARTGPLEAAVTRNGDCSVVGSVDGLSQGRWFVYAELQDSGGRALEAWIAAEDDARVSGIRPLYAPPTTTSSGAQRIAAAGLLLVVVALLVGCLRLGRRAATTV